MNSPLSSQQASPPPPRKKWNRRRHFEFWSLVIGVPTLVVAILQLVHDTGKVIDPAPPAASSKTIEVNGGAVTLLGCENQKALLVCHLQLISKTADNGLSLDTDSIVLVDRNDFNHVPVAIQIGEGKKEEAPFPRTPDVPIRAQILFSTEISPAECKLLRIGFGPEWFVRFETPSDFVFSTNE